MTYFMDDGGQWPCCMIYDGQCLSCNGGEISQASYNDLEQTHANGISNLCKIAREIGLKEGVVVVIRVKQKN